MAGMPTAAMRAFRVPAKFNQSHPRTHGIKLTIQRLDRITVDRGIWHDSVCDRVVKEMKWKRAVREAVVCEDGGVVVADCILSETHVDLAFERGQVTVERGKVVVDNAQFTSDGMQLASDRSERVGDMAGILDTRDVADMLQLLRHVGEVRSRVFEVGADGGHVVGNLREVGLRAGHCGFRRGCRERRRLSVRCS